MVVSNYSLGSSNKINLIGIDYRGILCIYNEMNDYSSVSTVWQDNFTKQDYSYKSQFIFPSFSSDGRRENLDFPKMDRLRVAN